jgi:hypothetical protein
MTYRRELIESRVQANSPTLWCWWDNASTSRSKKCLFGYHIVGNTQTHKLSICQNTTGLDLSLTVQLNTKLMVG